MAALDGALPFAQVDGVAMHVGQDLKFNVACAFDQALDVNPSIAECAFGFAAGGCQRPGEVFGPVHGAHSLASSAGDGFDQQRETDFPFGSRDDVLVAQIRLRAGDNRHACFFDSLTRRLLVAHRRNRVGRRANEDDTGVGDSLREALSLGEKAVAWMDGICTALAGCINHGVNLQITLARRRRPNPYRFVGVADVQAGAIRVRIDGDCLNA